MKKDNEYKEKSAKRLRYALELKEMKQQDLADKSGVSKNSISQYLSQRSVPSNLSAGKMAQVLQVDPMWLMGYDVPMIKGNSDSSTKFDNIFPIEIHKFPLLGEVACGEPIFMSEERESYGMSGAGIKADFCLRAKGNSMINARIMDGDIVFIRRQPEVENGEIAAVAIDDEATLKRFYRDESTGTITLVAENPAYAPMVFTAENQKNVYILEKAIAFQSDVR